MDAAPPPPPDHPGPLITAIFSNRSLEKIRSIVGGDPSLLRRRWEGNLPIHAALGASHGHYVQRRPDVVRYLLERWPESAREWTSSEGNLMVWRCLPIHFACLRAAVGGYPDDDAVQVLVEAWPESMRERDGEGRLALHYARDASVIRLMHQVDPFVIEDPGEDGRIALHEAVSDGHPLSALQALTELSPRSVRAKDSRGQTPLHCINRSTRVDTVQHLVDFWDDSVHQADDDGCLPLHRAAEEYGNPAVVRFLAGRAPDTARVRAADGCIPLHMALRRRETILGSSRLREANRGEANLGEIRALVTTYPESLRERTADGAGLLPLHLAARAGDITAVRFFLGQRPGSLRERTAKGWLAVHVAVGLKPGNRHEALAIRHRMATARFLLDQFPASIMEPTTSEGYLPLHVASRTGSYGVDLDPDPRELVDGAELELFEYLVELAPAAVRVESHEGLFPANYAVSVGCLSLGSTQFLFQQFPAAIAHRDARGRNMLHASIERDIPRPEIVQYLVHLRPEMLHETDLDGSTPLHGAVARHGELAVPIVTLLVERGPEALQVVDRRGNVPVHAAVARREPSLPMVSLLIDRRPQALLVTDSQGRLPLHAAVAQGGGHCPLDLVELLVQKCPESVRRADANGLPPLMVAAAAASDEADLDVLFFLATQWPEAVGGGRGIGSRQAAPLPQSPTSRPQKRVKSS